MTKESPGGGYRCIQFIYQTVDSEGSCYGIRQGPPRLFVVFEAIGWMLPRSSLIPFLLTVDTHSQRRPIVERVHIHAVEAKLSNGFGRRLLEIGQGLVQDVESSVEDCCTVTPLSSGRGTRQLSGV